MSIINTQARLAVVISLAFFLVSCLVGVSIPKTAQALSVDDEIRAAFQEMLDRAPTDVDLTNNRANFTTRQAIKNELNQWPERDLAIHSIYYRALGRAAMERELTQLKLWVAENNRIREQLFNTYERTLAVQNVYRRFLDREPEAGAADFYEITRSDIGDILAYINEGDERLAVLRHRIQAELGRDATEDEIAAFLEARADILNIRRGIRNPLIVEVTDSLGNVQENSWAVENTGAWSIEEYQTNPPAISVGDVITFTTRAYDYVPDEIETVNEAGAVESSMTSACAVEVIDGRVVNKILYKFTVGDSMDLIQDWSTDNSVTWTVDTEHLGRAVSITAWVKDNNLIERMGPGSGDDYTYLTYNILSSSENQDPILSSVTDSLGNEQTNSWIEDGTSGYYLDDEGEEVTPAVSIGDSITITAAAADPESDSLEYRFMLCSASGTCTVKQDWSSDVTYVWDITSDDIGYAVTWEIAVQDDNEILASGDHGDDFTMVTYEVEGTEGENAILTQVVDSEGNVRYDSYAKDYAGDEDDFNTLPYPVLHVGDEITFTASATDEEDDTLYYQFVSCKVGGSCVTDQEWSTDNTFTWTVTDEYVSPNTVVFVNVKDDNGENMVGDSGDDWMALTYQVWE